MSGPLGSRPHSEALPPVIQLRGYQQRWIDDKARFTLGVKSARIGFSFATGGKRLLRLLEKPNHTVTVLSASKAQSIEFVENVQKIRQAMGAVAEIFEEPFVDQFGVTSETQSRLQLANGSRMIALPANPRTARGYPGDAVLDEFAHHQDSYAIWAAVMRQLALGHEADVLSTPNGEQGKFFDLARDLGLVDGVAPDTNPVRKGPWSGHWVDVNLAVAEGCPINIEEMREGIKDDDTFAQEFLCVFLKAVGAWIGVDLIQAAEDDGATIMWPQGYVPIGPVYGGLDVARDRDKSVLWLDEHLGDVAWTRGVISYHGMPFPQQHKSFSPLVGLTTRTAIDSTGMGIALFDYLVQDYPGRVMGVNFAGNNDAGVKLKTDLAILLKKRLEAGKKRIPADKDIRQELMAIKREVTGTGVRFDAPRIEVDGAVAGGKKRKLYSHADSFWAAALAEFAARNTVPAALGSADVQFGVRSAQASDEVVQHDLLSRRAGGEYSVGARSHERRAW
ncbi:MAG TPA: terminase family protein [Clostridia bacterium]|nr:terminase family protein [Clostridia bacterium]